MPSPRRKNDAIEALCCDSPEPTSLANQLRSKKMSLLREYQKRAAEIDRQIHLLEATDAETVLAEASRVLYEM